MLHENILDFTKMVQLLACYSLGLKLLISFGMHSRWCNMDRIIGCFGRGSKSDESSIENDRLCSKIWRLSGKLGGLSALLVPLAMTPEWG